MGRLFRRGIDIKPKTARANPARKKHIPLRTCIACREKKSKRELLRIVRTTEGAIQVDDTGKLNGRGAYICRKASCWQPGLTSTRLAQALKVEFSNADRQALYDQLAKTLDVTP
jgi:uncharacterized protein